MNDNSENKIKNIIAVVSGKGGVGKSLVTSLLASKYQKEGYKVGILDADITGPSIPKMFGVNNILESDGKNIIPATAKNGTKVVSINLLLEDETQPVLWRGPIIVNAVRQFYEETSWGELDYLFIDMPPGTGDVPLSVFQLMPVSGIVVVSTPQELVSMIVQKAINMAIKMNVKILGLIENMSYFKCPDCGNIYNIFGNSNIDNIAKNNNLSVLAKLPFDSDISKYSDLGEIYNYQNENIEKIKFD